MTGSPAERHLLGAIILDIRQHPLIRDLVTAEDFADERLGRVFDGITEMIALGQHVDPVSIMNRWPEWEIRGVDPTEVYQWADVGDVYVHAASEYAASVRDDAVRRELRNAVQMLNSGVNDASFPPLDVAARATTLLQELRERASTGTMRTKTLNEVLSGEDAYDWAVPGLLERMDRLVITAGEGVGKTTFVRQMAVLSAAGLHPLRFTPMVPLKVLVIDAENTERQWRRSVRWMVREAWRQGSVDPGENIHVMAGKRIDITKGSHLSEIHRLIDIHEPDILCIGPLYKLVPKAINNDDDAAPLIVALDSLRERNVTLIMEAHPGKSNGSDGDRNLAPRGSSALLGWPEFGFGLRETPDDPSLVTLSRWRGDRDDSRSWPRALYRGGDWPWTPTSLPD